MAMKIFGVLVAILIFIEPSSAEMDLTVKYYATVSLTCDSLALNVSENMGEVDHLYWILSDGMLVDKDSDLPKDIHLSSDGYLLNITDAKDETFGYYHCIVLYKNKILKTVRKGINIDGPDFSDLYEQYRHSAMIGGIAAAVMLVVIGVGCGVWHFRFQGNEEEREDLYKERGNNSHNAYENSAVEMEDKIVPHDDKVNGTFDEKL